VQLSVAAQAAQAACPTHQEQVACPTHQELATLRPRGSDGSPGCIPAVVLSRLG